MSRNFISFLMAKEKYNNLNLTKTQHMKGKPEGKNINFEYMDLITYNLIESMTKFKNMEINYNQLNLNILGNLSLFMAKEKIDKKAFCLKYKNNKGKKNFAEKEINMQKFGIYFPTDRITFITGIKPSNNNNIQNNNIKTNKNSINKSASDFASTLNTNDKEIINRNHFKLPYTYERIKTFFPLGRNFLRMRTFKYRDSVERDYNLFDDNDYFYNDLTLKETKDKSKTSNSYNQESYDNLNENSSLVSDENLPKIDISILTNNFKEDNNILNSSGINIINNICGNMGNKNIFKNLKKFKKYKELIDYVECPLVKKIPSDKKYNNFINLLENFNNLDEYNDINFVNNFYLEDKNSDINFSEETDDINDNNFKTVFIDNFDFINVIKNHLNNSKSSFNSLDLISKNISNTQRYKSGIIPRIHNLNLSNSNSNLDFNPPKQKKTSIIKDNKSSSFSSSKDISPALKNKYLKKMNEIYISLIQKIYLHLISKCDLSEEYLTEAMNKKLFIQLLKTFLLNIGICNRKIYEKILKNQIFSPKLLTFDQFIQIFDIIIDDNDKINLSAKFSFLLNILTQGRNKEFLSSKKIENFFDMIGCSAIYIQDFCENLGERFILRFNFIYKRDEENSIILDLYRFRKLKIILDSFFDDFQMDNC